MRSPKRLLQSPAILILLIGFWLNAFAASAQVPYDMAYQGRLTDTVGAPLIGPVNLSMRIYDVIAGGSALYSEDHPNVAIDDVGAFSVKLGAGSVIFGTFNSALFAGVNRYLEVVVDGEVLAPRLVMGSVPYAMQAENATAAQATADAAQVRVTGSCPSGSSIRAINADGTVVCQTDTDTTLDEAQVDAFVENNGYADESAVIMACTQAGGSWDAAASDCSPNPLTPSAPNCIAPDHCVGLPGGSLAFGGCHLQDVWNNQYQLDLCG